MNIRGLIIAILAVGLMASGANAQKRLIRKADTLFSYGEYYTAIEKYTKALGKAKKKERKTKICYMLAESFRNMNNPPKAASYYARAIRGGYPDTKMALHLADAYMMMEKYEKALEAYNEYLKIVPDDPQGLNGVKACEILQEWLDNPTRHIVNNVEGINSRQDDFAPSYAREDFREVYFTSTRAGAKGVKFNNNSGNNFTDIFVTLIDKKEEWSEPNVLGGENINTEYDDGTTAFNADMSEMYFSRASIEEGANIGAKIYIAKKMGKNWTKPEQIIIVNDSSVSVGHPSISKDGLTLYFAAKDLEGGYGGRDIWKIERQKVGGAWGEPINLGKTINTSEDEMFPYSAHDGKFYFSSNGHMGMGGLDLFVYYKDEETDKMVLENMKYPMNSSGDDFGIVFQGEEQKGLFTSNRQDGRGGDDIYSFELPTLKFTLLGTIVDEETREPLAGADVQLTGSDGTFLEMKTEKDGTFKFNLKAKTDYLIFSTKKDYLNGKGKETTKGLTENKDISMEIVMTNISEGKVIELQNIEYDFASHELRPESKVELDKLVETMNDNPGIVIELASHTDYIGKDTANMSLSQRRAQSVVDYLITKEINPARMEPQGYGETKPSIVKEKVAKKYDFLAVGDTLTEEFIKHMQNEQHQEVCNQLNRRTEFSVLRQDFDENAVPKKEVEEEVDNEGVIEDE